MHFPDKVSYFEGGDDLPGDKEKGVLRIKNGQMVVVYKTDDPHWWIGKVFVADPRPEHGACGCADVPDAEAERAVGAYSGSRIRAVS